MKETTCPLCGEHISIADETTYKQHILCPYCGGKFSYLLDSAEFSAERLAYAIAECQKHSVDSRYYNRAPAGARMYIGLLFYGKVFKDGMDANLYLAAMRKVEPQLKKRDWQYLLENENDPELAAYYKDRMDMAHVGPSSAVSLHVSDYFKADTNTIKAVAMPRKAEPKTDRRTPKKVPIKCPRCGKGIEVDDNVEIGQHISCPYCEGKFSFSKGCVEKDDVGNEKSTADPKERSRIKDQRDRKAKKHKRTRMAVAKLVAYGCFFASLLVSGVVYAYRQHVNRLTNEARKELALYMSGNSKKLSDWHSRYSESIRECKEDMWIFRNNQEVAEKLRMWTNKALFVQAGIKGLIHAFSDVATRLESIDLYTIKLTQSDFEEQMQDLTQRVHQFGFTPPNVSDSLMTEGKNESKFEEPTPPPAKKPTTPTEEPVMPTEVLHSEPSAPTPVISVLSERELLQMKIDELIGKLKKLKYSFDPDSLKQYTLVEQKTILEEMLYDAEMLQAKEQNSIR